MRCDLTFQTGPRWLLTKNRRQQALDNLCWIRHLSADELYIVEEIAFLDAALEEQSALVGSGFWEPFKAVGKSKKVQWRFFLGGMLFLWQNGSGKISMSATLSISKTVADRCTFLSSGINAINYYSPTVFASIGVSGTNTSFLTTGIFGVVKTCLTFVWLFILIDRLGRRLLLMIGAAGGSICMWILGGYIATITIDTDSDAGKPLSSGGVAAIFFFYLWTAFYTPSWVRNQPMKCLRQTLTVSRTEHPGFTTQKCLTSPFVPLGRLRRRRIIGSGTSSSLGSPRRCFSLW